MAEIAGYVGLDEVATVEGIQDSGGEGVGSRTGITRLPTFPSPEATGNSEAGHLLFNNKIIGDYLERNIWRVRENSNMTYSLQGMNFHISSLIVSQYWLNKIYPPEVREAHIRGDYHVHDLDWGYIAWFAYDAWKALTCGARAASGTGAETFPLHTRGTDR